MTHHFIPYGILASDHTKISKVKLTGKSWEIGFPPIYKYNKVIEVVDTEGTIHEALEDELLDISIPLNYKSINESKN